MAAQEPSYLKLILAQKPSRRIFMSCVCKVNFIRYRICSSLSRSTQCFSHTKTELEDTRPNEKRVNESHMERETLYFDIVNHKYICHGTQLNSFPSEKEDFVFGSSSSNFLSFGERRHVSSAKFPCETLC